MPEGADERPRVVRLVADGGARPREALDRMTALEPVAGGNAARRAGDLGGTAVIDRGPEAAPPTLDVHCRDAGQACEFCLPVEDISQLAEVVPPGVAQQVPAALLEPVARLVRTRASGTTPRDRDAPFELEVRRQRG